MPCDSSVRGGQGTDIDGHTLGGVIMWTLVTVGVGSSAIEVNVRTPSSSSSF